MSAPHSRRTWLTSVAGLAALAIIAVTLHATIGQSGRGGPHQATSARGVGNVLPPDRELVIYCGRSESLVGEVINRFQRQSGIDVQVKYGRTGMLAALIVEEGRRSPADVFFAQDPGGLGMLAERGFLSELPGALLDRVPYIYRDSDKQWLGVTGRLRTMTYAIDRVDREALPRSVLELTEEKWHGRVGWAPANASFQAMVTAMRHELGDAKTEQWLRDMLAAGVRTYPRNTPIVQAVQNGEVDLGLVNHYYLHRFRAERGELPIANHVPAGDGEDGDVGGAMLVSGASILSTTRNRDEARAFLEFLLSEEIQQYFAETTFEYPLANDMSSSGDIPALESLPVKPVELTQLSDLEATIRMLRRVGALR